MRTPSRKRGRQFVPGVQGGFFQSLDDIPEGRFPYAKLLGQFLHRGRQFAAQFGNSAPAGQVCGGVATQPQELFGNLIGLGVDGGGIQGILAIPDAQEAGALLEGGLPQAGDFEELSALGKTALLLAPGHNGLGHGGLDSGNIGE